MDRFVYKYHLIGGERSNRLSIVSDNGTDYSNYDDIKSGQHDDNYTYNKIGELIEDTQEDMILHWRTGDHKLSKIERNDQDSPQLEFFYNPFGQRSMKVEKPRVSGVIQANSEWKYTYYAYDANGQVMAVYSGNFQGSSEQVKLAEQHLYGAERLGMITRDVVVFDNGVTSYTHKEEDVVHLDIRGHKRYELTNHLGNVLAVINDRKVWNATDGNYDPVILSWSDYYAFGMTMPNRHGGVDYRYLFNGMEHDGEVSGNGNSYTTEFRQYDPRLGRWKSLDPLMADYPQMSPYVAFNNNPVFFVDPLGLEGEPVNINGGSNTKGSMSKEAVYLRNNFDGAENGQEVNFNYSNDKKTIHSYKYDAKNNTWVGSYSHSGKDGKRGESKSMGATHGSQANKGVSQESNTTTPEPMIQNAAGETLKETSDISTTVSKVLKAGGYAGTALDVYTESSRIGAGVTYGKDYTVKGGVKHDEYIQNNKGSLKPVYSTTNRVKTNRNTMSPNFEKYSDIKVYNTTVGTLGRNMGRVGTLKDFTGHIIDGNIGKATETVVLVGFDRVGDFLMRSPTPLYVGVGVVIKGAIILYENREALYKWFTAPKPYIKPPAKPIDNIYQDRMQKHYYSPSNKR